MLFCDPSLPLCQYLHNVAILQDKLNYAFANSLYFVAGSLQGHNVYIIIHESKILKFLLFNMLFHNLSLS